MRTVRRALIVVFLLASAGAAIAELFPTPPDRIISIDFKAPGCPLASADNHGSARFGGQIGLWNALDVLQGKPPQSVVNTEIRTGPLNNGAGEPTSVTFALNTNSNEITVWKGATTKDDEVRRDWIRVSTPRPRSDWRIEGLIPGESYDLAFYGGLAAGVLKAPGEWRAGHVDARNGAQSDAIIESVRADQSGMIKGSFSAITGSYWAGWSGLQIHGKFGEASESSESTGKELAPSSSVLAAWSFDGSVGASEPIALACDGQDSRLEVSPMTSNAGRVVVQPRIFPTKPVLITRPNAPRSNKATTAERAVKNGTYLEFTITPKADCTLNLAELTIDAGRGVGGISSGQRGFVIRSSVDNFAADLLRVTLLKTSREDVPPHVGTLQHERVKLAAPGFQGLSRSNPVTFRIYSFESTRMAGSEICFDNIIINGTVSPQVQ